MKSASIFLPLLALCGVLHAQPQWQVDSASVAFDITNAGLPVHGSFAGLEADVRFDPDNPGHSKILASIDASTVDAGISLRNKHLRKHAYFYVDRYPSIRMESVRIEKKNSDTYNGTFEGLLTINRLDFGIGESSVILSNIVTVHLIVEVSRMSSR